jgi:GNAT superfamily N-acetyltransferase
MVSAYAIFEERLGSVRLPPMNLDYAAEINSYPTWVAVVGRNVVGGLTMVFDDESASIANIAVDPAEQGQGLGGGLIKFAESEAKRRGFSALRLATHVMLTENLSLYRHQV